MSPAYHVHPECIDRRTFSGTGHSRNPDADRLPCMRQAFLDNLLRLLLVFVPGALDQRHRLTKHRGISAQDAFDKLMRRERARSFTHLLQIRADSRCNRHPTCHFQSFIFFVVFGMIHCFIYRLKSKREIVSSPSCTIIQFFFILL